jgi:hypothetical protein
MPAELAIDQFNPLAWVNEYTQPAMDINEDTFGPTLHFSLMWNLFERDACERNATPANIKKAVESAFASKRLTLLPFQEHLQYFKSRAQCDGMTIVSYLDALKMTHENARHLVDGVLSGTLTDSNNAVYALLLIAHRIRNNLFHGEKNVVTLHTQAHLFRTVNSLLATYLNITKNAA